MALVTTISGRISATQTSAIDLVTASAPITVDFSHALTSGTGSGAADLMFSDTRTLTASSTENLDLAGVLTDAFGTALTFVTIKAIMIKASSANTNNVLVGGAASNTFLNWVGDATDILVVKPGGTFLIVAPATGYAVTASTGDILKVANSSSGTSVVYDVVILGTSA